ncbi:spore coat protein [Bacillus tianshenii]|uniref:spore coat protein n=1 Tax=Sutcliffiella tianshenii TaxID=1463404 RepID=UPI001CD4D314|nr:spore coat protein [Bacillus tianshenii]MCA1320683.1 spore coat protein [Bacillus tianshenii]
MYNCRPNMMGPIVHPTKCCVKNLQSVTEVTHIHPSHTTYVNNQMFQHKHYFPHTESMVDSVSHQNFNCGPGAPGMGQGAPGMGQGAPGQVMGAFQGPGGMPGGQVLGASQGPGMGYGGMPGGPGMGYGGGMPGQCKQYGR